MIMDKNAYIAWAVFAVVCLIILIVSKRMNKQTEENGIETTGVISRIEDTGDANDIDICYYARYRTEDGDEVEGILSNPTDDLAVGQEVRLKYHPVYKMNARLIKK